MRWTYQRSQVAILAVAVHLFNNLYRCCLCTCVRMRWTYQRSQVAILAVAVHLVSNVYRCCLCTNEMNILNSRRHALSILHLVGKAHTCLLRAHPRITHAHIRQIQRRFSNYKWSATLKMRVCLSNRWILMVSILTHTQITYVYVRCACACQTGEYYSRTVFSSMHLHTQADSFTCMYVRCVCAFRASDEYPEPPLSHAFPGYIRMHQCAYTWCVSLCAEY